MMHIQNNGLHSILHGNSMLKRYSKFVRRLNNERKVKELEI